MRDRQGDVKTPGRRPADPVPPWQHPESPAPIPDHLCQLCERDLASWGGSRDGLCPDCSALLLLEDHQEWVEAGGRTCRRCRTDLAPAQLVDGLCPCGGAPW